MRPLVSYDDITLPYQPQPILQSNSHSSRPPPAKKRKSNHRGTRHKFDNSNHRPNNYNIENRNENSASFSVTSDMDYEEGENEESRELTHEEIWDDSALIDAWNAATEEYEAYNGSDKNWKLQPPTKSPLWYNIPFPSSKKVLTPQAPSDPQIPKSSPRNSEDAPDDSRPLDFGTFVPTHDPSLELPLPPQPPSIPRTEYSSRYLPDPSSGTMVHQDEAFSRALEAMYWGGYWTAIYHCRRAETHDLPEGQDSQTDVRSQGEDESEEEKEFVSTQR